MAVAFETSDMILTREQAEHKFPPRREERPVCVEIYKNFQPDRDLGVADAENLGSGAGGEL